MLQLNKPTVVVLGSLVQAEGPVLDETLSLVELGLQFEHVPRQVLESARGVHYLLGVFMQRIPEHAVSLVHQSLDVLNSQEGVVFLRSHRPDFLLQRLHEARENLRLVGEGLVRLLQFEGDEIVYFIFIQACLENTLGYRLVAGLRGILGVAAQKRLHLREHLVFLVLQMRPKLVDLPLN